MSGFAIAEVPVMAGWLGICPLPGRSGDYRGDLGAIHAWAPDMVLSLASQGEMRGVANGFGTDLGRNGVAWRHFPITDFGVPTEAEGALWPMLAQEALGWLDRGGRVLVHCKGGCGRSGMIALRLMAEAGEAPATALARLRAARPCAVETDEQYAWAVEGL
ncbi:MAG: protein phosphatase [Rhodobacteraceae bacterium]|nr:protein phosphatase [Paracoccaceae bacterium]